MCRKLSLTELLAIIATIGFACWFGRVTYETFLDCMKPYRIVVHDLDGGTRLIRATEAEWSADYAKPK